MLSRCFLDFSVGVGAFVIGLSLISSFFSYSNTKSYSKFHLNMSKHVEGKCGELCISGILSYNESARA